MSEQAVRTVRTVRLLPWGRSGARCVCVTTETNVVIAPSGDETADTMDLLAAVSDALGRMVTEKEAQRLAGGGVITFALE